MNLDYLFVYGTLRCGCNNPMAEFLNQHADFIAEASYQGQLYRISYYPGLIVSNDALDRVTGDLYQLQNAEAVFTCLDEYEGCSPHHPKPTEYIRRQDWVRLKNGESVLAWLYFYNYPTEELELINSGDFLHQ